MNRFLLLFLAILALAAVPALAQAAPSVDVADQVVLDGTVTIAKATLAEPGFMVIHRQEGGSVGPVIGQRLLSPGDNFNVAVPIDASQATSTLYAMLHFDTGAVGVYEFGSVEGADLPVTDASGAVVAPPFAVSVLNVSDQLLDGNTFTATSATIDVQGWLVIHSDNGGSPGPVLGQTQIQPGINENVVVQLGEGLTPVLWPMLHVDTGAPGEYEFGTVEGADSPVVVGGVVATAAAWTVPHMRVADQVVSADAPSITVASALLAEPGFVVIHQESDGSPGPVAGVSEALPAGLSTNLTIELDPALVTPRVWPMLHVDTGEAGVYEFGTVDGADLPVTVDGDVVTFPIDAAPAIIYEGTFANGQVTIDKAVIDVPGWLVIHSDNGGSPGPVLGQTQLTPGVNRNVVVSITDPGASGLVFPMLHVDTGAPGVYEFGTVDGADLPISVNDVVVVGPFRIGDGAVAAPAEATPAAGGACTVTAGTAQGANLRSGPSTGNERTGSLGGTDSATADGQATGSDGFIWYRLTTGSWIRSDVAAESGDCAALPVVDAGVTQPPAAAATTAPDATAAPAVATTVPEPAGTEEP